MRKLLKIYLTIYRPFLTIKKFRLITFPNFKNRRKSVFIVYEIVFVIKFDKLKKNLKKYKYIVQKYTRV